MLCDDCRQRPASVHVAQSINGQNTEVHLCQECAGRRGEVSIWTHPNLLMNFFTQLANPPSAPQAVAPPATHCPACGLGYQQFLNTSLLGCSECYAAFRDQLDHLMRQFQAGPRHQGKIPLRRGGTTRIRRKVQQLRMELAKAVELEQYEQAAVLRDELRKLEREGDPRLEGG